MEAHTPSPLRRPTRRVLAPLAFGLTATAAIFGLVDLKGRSLSAASPVAPTALGRVTTATAGPPKSTAAKSTAAKSTAALKYDVADGVTLSTMASGATVVPTSPHVFFFLLDDMGWNDIGYQSTDIPLATPFMDELAGAGVKLTKYYSEYECTPARASLMTGKMPIKLGMMHECITPTSVWGLGKGEATMASMFSEAGGYKTHIVGKWDLGHYAVDLWPTERGFDSFYGLTCYGYDDYSTHDNKGFWDLHDFNKAEGRFAPDQGAFGVYSTTLFGERCVDIVNAHPPEEPLFLYVPFNAVHNTLSVPEGFSDTDVFSTLTKDVTYGNRKLFAGAAYVADQEVKRVVGALKLKGMYENTVVVMASDNGGSPTDGGNDWPLRGAKKTLFEGGVRVPAFVHSPLLAPAVVGTAFKGLVHVCDWAPTLVLGAAGLTLEGDRAAEFDGFNLWEALNKGGGESPRKEVLLNIDYVTQTGSEAAVTALEDVWMGLIMEIEGREYKVLTQQYDYTYYSPGTNAPWGNQVEETYGDFIFDLTGDPYERHNLLEHQELNGAKGVDLKAVIEVLSARLCHFYGAMHPTQYKGEDNLYKKYIVQLHNDWITWYGDYDDSTLPGLRLEDAPTCTAAELAARLWAKASTDEDDGQFDDDVSVHAKATTNAQKDTQVDGQDTASPGSAPVTEEQEEAAKAEAERRAEADAAADAAAAAAAAEPDAISLLLKRKASKLGRSLRKGEGKGSAKAEETLAKYAQAGH